MWPKQNEQCVKRLSPLFDLMRIIRRYGARKGLKNLRMNHVFIDPV